MSKHTPGPWEIERESGSHSITNRSFDGDEWCIAEVYRESDMAIANANLIAAAPDLLEALQVMTDELASHLYDERSIRESEVPEIMSARKAIARAKGESQ